MRSNVDNRSYCERYGLLTPERPVRIEIRGSVESGDPFRFRHTADVPITGTNN